MPDKSATLEELVKNEKGEKKRTATEGLMWLLRCGESLSALGRNPDVLCEGAWTLPHKV